jgi:hypothetical protein
MTIADRRSSIADYRIVDCGMSINGLSIVDKLSIVDYPQSPIRRSSIDDPSSANRQSTIR